MLFDNDYQKRQSIDRGAVAGPDCDLKATAQLQLAPHASEETGNTAGLGLHRIEAWENDGKAGDRRPKRGPNLASSEARGLASQGESRSREGAAAPSVSARARTKASGRPEARRSVSWNAVALALCAFFVFVVLASCIAVNGRTDSFVPRELR